MGLILGYFEIDRFKENKCSKYFKTIHEISKFEQKVSTIKENIFQNLL